MKIPNIGFSTTGILKMALEAMHVSPNMHDQVSVVDSPICYKDINIWRRHQMETFSALPFDDVIMAYIICTAGRGRVRCTQGHYPNLQREISLVSPKTVTRTKLVGCILVAIADIPAFETVSGKGEPYPTPFSQ